MTIHRRCTAARPFPGCAALLGAAAALAVAAGCSSSGSKPAGGTPVATMDPIAVDPAVEARFVVGPTASRRLGYRIDWQQSTAGGRPIKDVALADDSLLVLDDRNGLMRLDLDSGRRVWSVPVADATDEILGMNLIRDVERVFVWTSGDLFILDASTGELVDRHTLEQIAATPPVIHGQFFIYGARNGRLIWRSWLLGAAWRAYEISGSIRVPPVSADGYVVAAGGGGRVMCLLAGSASQVWSRQALDEIVASPAIGQGVVYVASLDQHLRAYALGEDRTPLWEYLTEGPLVDSPVLVDDRVYQQVPGSGLVALEARPLDSPGGVVAWKAEECRGSVLTVNGGDVLAWDPDATRLDVLDGRLGEVIETWNLPGVTRILADDVRDASLYAVGGDGRVIRLVPRNR